MNKNFSVGNLSVSLPLKDITRLKPTNLSFKGASLPPALEKDTVNFSNSRLTANDLDCWDSAVTQMVRYDFENLSSLKNLSQDERIALKKHLSVYRDIEPFLLMSTGGRPAMGTVNTPLLEKLSDDFDVVEFCKSSNFIFNRNEMLKKIEQHRDFYLKRLNLTDEASNEQIYNTFIAEDGPLYKVINVQDLIGISFGYPVIDSIIFQLEADSSMRKNILEQRKNLDEYKKNLLDTLYAKDSRYVSFDDVFKKKIEKAIKSIDVINLSTKYDYPHGYTFVKFTDSSIDEAEIAQNIRKSTQEIEKINKKTEQERLRQDLDSFEDIDFWGARFIKELYSKYGNIL